ncbi:hypothetical protein EJB05_56846, partial [Eragrostis curvula]
MSSSSRPLPLLLPLRSLPPPRMTTLRRQSWTSSPLRVMTPWDETISRHWRRNVRLGCQCRRRSMKRTTMNFLPVQNLKEFFPRREGAIFY